MDYTYWFGVQQYPVPDGYAVLTCEFCKTTLGLFKASDLVAGFKPGIFKPLRPGLWPPFPYPDLAWEHVLCPTCRHQPFFNRAYVMTPFGKMALGQPPPRPKTPEQVLAEERQIAINAAWEAETEAWNQEIDLTVDDLKKMYPDLSPVEINQKYIDMTFGEDEDNTKEEEERPDIPEPETPTVSPVRQPEPEVKKFMCKWCGERFKHAPTKWAHQPSCPKRPKRGKKE